MSSVVKKARALLKNGYQVIPISPEGRPLVSGFLDVNTEYNERDAKQWKKRFNGAGLALVAGKNRVYALDFDVDDLPVAKTLIRYLKKKHPKLPIRFCNPPRFAILFRAHKSVLQYSNAHSKGYKRIVKGKIKGKINQVELIGFKTITLFGNHRKSKQKYHWNQQSKIMETHSSDLPVLKIKDIEKIFKLYAKSVTGKWSEVSKSSFSKPSDEVTFETARAERIFTDDEVDEILSRAVGHSRNDWLEVGFGLHKHFKASEEGLDRWDEWSSAFDGYVDKQDCRTQWYSFKESGTKTLASVQSRTNYEERTEAKKDLPTLDDYLKNKVLIESEGLVADLSEYPTEALLTYEKLRIKSLKYIEIVHAIDGRSGETVEKEVNVFDLWKKDPRMIEAYATAYWPGGERLIDAKKNWRDKQRCYYNSYIPTFCHMSMDTNLVHHFIDHIEYLFPGDGDAKWMMNWMAQLIQHPSVRMRATPLSIATFHGTGRGWLGQVLNEVVGDANVSTVNGIEDLVRPGAKTGFLHNTTLCFITETHSRGGQQYKVDDALRRIIGDDKQNVDIKFGEQKERQIFTRLWMQSNHTDAVVLDEADNRIDVIISRVRPKSPKYYAKLYELKDYKKSGPEFINQVYTYLVNYDVNTQALQSSRRSEARETLINATRSKLASCFFEFRSIVGQQYFHKAMLLKFMADYTVLMSDGADQMTSTDGKELQFLYKQEVHVHQTLKVSKTKRIRVSAFAPSEDEISQKKLTKSVEKSKQLIKLYFDNPKFK